MCPFATGPRNIGLALTLTDVKFGNWPPCVGMTPRDRANRDTNPCFHMGRGGAVRRSLKRDAWLMKTYRGEYDKVPKKSKRC